MIEPLHLQILYLCIIIQLFSLKFEVGCPLSRDILQSAHSWWLAIGYISYLFVIGSASGQYMVKYY